ncbi:MAG: 3'(2'),5'-bisphosphate nucleotidase CysQ, partial [Candidatus Obscuribacterales bacterium]|nr:3'(2'),5'-bisphosphate nucleotidase CysQ [Candidatus Obscuribacterales bacterium]
GDDDILFVCKLADEAGALAIKLRAGVSIGTKTGPTDPVTSADIALSELIVDELKRRFPDDLIVSEEDVRHPEKIENERVWFVDPIDGTDNYIKQNGQYSVMIGLLENEKPVFGVVFEPDRNTCYFGGPAFGAFKQTARKKPEKLFIDKVLADSDTTRLMMGNRDRRKHPWVEELDSVDFFKTGSIGLKVARILENQADLFVHLSGKLKVWDTAGPAAIALAGGLEAGTLEHDQLRFPLPSVYHRSDVIMGRKGCLSWCRKHLSEPD